MAIGPESIKGLRHRTFVVALPMKEGLHYFLVYDSIIHVLLHSIYELILFDIGSEAHGGSCYCAVAALSLMENLHILTDEEIDNLRLYCLQR